MCLLHYHCFLFGMSKHTDAAAAFVAVKANNECNTEKQQQLTISKKRTKKCKQ